MMRLVELVLHFDKHLGHFIDRYGTATYWILFAIIFCETGLVVTPILPGDSLLFAVGIFCHPEKSPLGIVPMFCVFMAAAFAGDTCNYCIGRYFGHHLFKNENSKLFKKSYLDQTHAFFEKHGKKTIVLARFVPIVRTFAPFVAGLGEMPYVKFIGWSILGTGLWVGIFLGLGYFIGQIPVVQQHFFYAVLVMVAITGAPLVLEVYKGIRESRRPNAEEPAQPAVVPAAPVDRVS